MNEEKLFAYLKDNTGLSLEHCAQLGIKHSIDTIIDNLRVALRILEDESTMVQELMPLQEQVELLKLLSSFNKKLKELVMQAHCLHSPHDINKDYKTYQAELLKRGYRPR